MIPFFLPKYVCREIDNLISSFVWCKTVPRMRRVFLEVPKSAGGLDLPNFISYYWAANISKLPYWISTWRNDQGPVWAKMELYSEPAINPISLLSSSIPVRSHPQVLNPVLRHSLKIWFQFRKQFHFTHPSLFSPLLNNHLSYHPKLILRLKLGKNVTLSFLKTFSLKER